MPTDRHARTGVDVVDETRLVSAVKLLLVVGALFVTWVMVTNLPGAAALVPSTEVSYAALLGALVTLGVVAVLGYVAVTVEPLVESALTGPADLVSDAASLVEHLVLFVAVVTAYRGFEPVVDPSLDAVGLAWAYHLLFLALALVPTAVVAVRMYANVDELATLLAGRVTDDGTDDERDDGDSVSTRW
jgi:hypothetical protein